MTTDRATPGPGGPAWPAVSVVVPVVDEERELRSAVGRILDQDYPGELDVVLAVGPSRDATPVIAAELAAANPHVQVVANESGRTPAGLNAAVRATSNPVVVRVDGHGLLPQGYVRTAVELLQRTGADNVGGMMVPEGATPFERAVAWAMSTRWGIGGAAFHVGGAEGPVESVYLGVFRRSALERLGGFDEGFVRAQDWELNHRIRESGGTVWFSPLLRVTYRPRSGVAALARQFFTTGQWRRQVMRRYPATASVRYLAPPVAVVALATGAALGLASLVTGARWARAGWLAPTGYVAGVAVATVAGARRLDGAATARLPGVLAVMHLAWGAGFLRGAPRRPEPTAAAAGGGAAAGGLAAPGSRGTAPS